VVNFFVGITFLYLLNLCFQVFASLMKDNKEGDKNHSPALKS